MRRLPSPLAAAVLFLGAGEGHAQENHFLWASCGSGARSPALAACVALGALARQRGGPS